MHEKKGGNMKKMLELSKFFLEKKLFITKIIIIIGIADSFDNIILRKFFNIMLMKPSSCSPGVGGGGYDCPKNSIVSKFQGCSALD